MLRKIFSIFIVSCVLTSCSIEEATTFKSDFSGKTTTTVDMSAMITFMTSMDSSGSGKSKFYKEIQQGMDSVKNSKENDLNLEMKFDTVTNALSVSFAFKNLDEANAIAKKLREKQQTLSGDASVLYRWEKKGKILVMPGLEDVGKLMGQSGGSNPMLSSMTYTMVRTFPKKIVKVSDSRITLSNGDKTMTFKSTADQLINNPLKEITVTFK